MTLINSKGSFYNEIAGVCNILYNYKISKMSVDLSNRTLFFYAKLKSIKLNTM